VIQNIVNISHKLFKSLQLTHYIQLIDYDPYLNITNSLTECV